MSARARIVKLLLIVVAPFLLALSAAMFFLPAEIDRRFNKISSASTKEPSAHAKTLHKTLTIVDLHADSLLWDRDLLIENGDRGHVDIPRMIEGNEALQAFTIVTKVPHDAKLEGNDPHGDDIGMLAVLERWPIPSWWSLKERALYQTSKLHDFAARSNGELTIIKSAQDLRHYLERREHDSSCAAGFLGVEGAHCLEGDLDNIDTFFDHGVRMMAPTHFFDNDIGSSAHGRLHKGLTDKGKEMIRRMQAKSMIVDLAHASGGVIKDTLEIATRPVVVSHTGVKGTCDNARNLTDDEITGIARTGGVIGIGYWPTAVGGSDAGAIARAIRYTANRVGIEHVALGSDYDGCVTVPFDSSHLINLTQALIDVGFTDDEIRMIMGANAIRVLLAGLPQK